MAEGGPVGGGPVAGLPMAAGTGAAVPDVVAAARVTVRLIVEVLSGHRAPHQLTWRASDRVRDALSVVRRPVRRVRRTVPPRVISVRVQRPASGRAEVSAVAMLDERVHAVALCLEAHRGQWRCTAVETTAVPG